MRHQTEFFGRVEALRVEEDSPLAYGGRAGIQITGSGILSDKEAVALALFILRNTKTSVIESDDDD